MSRMSRYQQPPREIVARFESACEETGKPILKGDLCLYVPREKRTYHIDSKTAEDWRSQQFADANYLMDANW